MLSLVTGVAGFIGSHLARRLLSEGCLVWGVDCFSDYYSRRIKERNIRSFIDHPHFTLLERDLLDCPDQLLEGVDVVFHQAAQPGVRASWGKEFTIYTRHNILATQRLLEAARKYSLKRFVFASSSSVYGKAVSLPMEEESLPRPVSPYGVSKLAAEHLCSLYYRNFKVPTVSLRYFTVYGPGQRPDMAFHRFVRAAYQQEELTIFGIGEQTRDFTFIDDIVEANLAASRREEAVGNIYNIGGGSRISINGVISILNRLVGQSLKVKYLPVQAGDPPHTYADTSRARQDLGFSPQVTLEEGLKEQIQDLTALFQEGL
ncbi:MAG TPA: NAD-dependent epimerase/dehydratase family protein [Firmicutes bacterium]|nr:NAD-dependent epimerase/dehydratase family protein [Bacillota bacterium]